VRSLLLIPSSGCANTPSHSPDIWASGAERLSAEDRQNINFSFPDRLETLRQVSELVHTSKQKCLEKRWIYTRKSGETVIFRDIFDKFVKWVDLFKQAGDVAVQYDPAHASLPWAGVRFVLQVGDAMTQQKSFT
jgi:hypothetical protein